MIEVVVIGTGMSGIACARELHAAGVPVRLIDKGRGIGGRVATRRTVVAGKRITFDHGAQYLDRSKEASTTAALAKGASESWYLGDGTSRIVGVPSMAALSKALAHGLDVTLNTRVQKIESCGGLYEIKTDTGKTMASHVVVTVPAPQLAPILGEKHAIVQQASRAVMRPCLTLMAAFNRDTPAPFVTRRDANDSLTWIARNDTKPGRSKAYQTWVAQAHLDWSAKNIDADRSETKTLMVDLLCSVLGVRPTKLCHAGLQAWRYGLVATPVGKPFLTQGTLWAGGDWCCGPKVQDAWRSGISIATNVMHTLGSLRSVGSEVSNQS